MTAKRVMLVFTVPIISVFLLVTSPVFSKISIAEADSLIIQNDGGVILLVDDNVLGTSDQKKSSAPTSQQNQSQPSKQSDKQPEKPQSTKKVQLVAPNSPTIIQANPSQGTNKKVNVTIQNIPARSAVQNISPNTTIPQSKPQGQISPSSSPSTQLAQPTSTPKANLPVSQVSPSPLSSPSPINTQSALPVSKTVDSIILEGPTNNPVISIKSSEQNQITLQQDKTRVETNLPVQINNQTHAVSVVSPSGPIRLNVLPQEAVQGVIQQGIINGANQNTKVTIAQEEGNTFYDIKGERQGKLLGIFTVKTPVEVKLSTQTGKVNTVSQSAVFRIFGFLIR